MKVSSESWARYIGILARINRKASQLMQSYIDKHGIDDNKSLLDFAFQVATSLGEMNGSLACQMYDELARLQGAHVPSAEMADTATYHEVARAVNGTMLNRHSTVPATVERLTKQVSADTMLKNVKRDHAEWAWIPSGKETCAFCIALASKGWQPASKMQLRGAHASHIHANCDCEFAIRFDGKSGIEGYEPERYYEMYMNADPSNDPVKKINALRRTLDEKNSESEEYKKIVEDCKKSGVKYNEVRNLDKPLSDIEIIEKLAGGDETKGSCSSLALAYIGNKNGMDVTDFRGGNSLKVFLRRESIEKIAHLPGVKSVTLEVDIEAKEASKILNDKLEEGKEYYFAAGRHAAIVRKIGNEYQYLELQLPRENGWKPFDTYGSMIKTLKRRFGCRATKHHLKVAGYKYLLKKKIFLMDCDSFKGNKEFQNILGYINTEKNKQKKGKNGRVK